MDLSKNHAVIIADLSDTDTCAALAADPEIAKTGFSKLTYGWNVVTLFCWLKQKLGYASTDTVEQIAKLDLPSPPSHLTLAKSLLKLAYKDVAYVNNQRGIYGGNIIIPTGTKADFTEEDMLSVLQLISGCGLTTFLNHSNADKLGGNYLIMKKLNRLIEHITFPIPSIAVLLQALGYTYLIENPYLDDGVAIGIPIYKGYFSIMYDKYYKIVPADLLAALASEGLLKQPLSLDQVAQFRVLTNH